MADQQDRNIGGEIISADMAELFPTGVAFLRNS